jgi:hypothetical protein
MIVRKEMPALKAHYWPYVFGLHNQKHNVRFYMKKELPLSIFLIEAPHG